MISLTDRVTPKTTSLLTLLTILVFLPLLLLAVGQAVIFISRATGTPARIVVDTQTVIGTVKTDFYHAFSQGGEEATDMLSPVTNEVKALKPKLIRIDHIYDHYDVVRREGGNLTFHFEKLDISINTILSTGAKPVLSLSFMPPAIARGSTIINVPERWDEWAYVVQKTIEHYSGRNEKNISGVYYEVWNEPDLEQFGKWQLSGEKNYLTLYRYAAQGAANAKNVNAFLLGGPATSGLSKQWIIALVKSGYRVNFLSWHSYLQSPTRFDEDQRNLISWILPYPHLTLIPKMITEFGFTGEKDLRYGSFYAAAYTAATIRQLIAGGPTYLFSFQLKDGPGQQEGNGWGLITHEDNGKRLKPRYFLYLFLDLMAGSRLQFSGEGTWVTGFATTNGPTTRILLVNFDQNGNHTENVPVSFTGLSPGTYTYRERLLLGRNVTFKEIVTSTTLSKQVYMPAQSVAILELTRQ